MIVILRGGICLPQLMMAALTRSLLSLTEITGDSRYAAFAEQVTDHFVREDGEILTLDVG